VDERCGTYSGANRHKRRKETLCGPCRQAHAAYMAEFRARSGPSLQTQERRLVRARSRAAWRLVDRYRDEWRQLVVEELEQP
jgi:hypothetical protein